MFKKNVVEKEYHFFIKNPKTYEIRRIVVSAESRDSAILKIPAGWKLHMDVSDHDE